MVFCYLLWEKKCSSNGEKLLKFEAKGREFARYLRFLEEFIWTVNGQSNPGGFLDSIHWNSNWKKIIGI